MPCGPSGGASNVYGVSSDLASSAAQALIVRDMVLDSCRGRESSGILSAVRASAAATNEADMDGELTRGGRVQTGPMTGHMSPLCIPCNAHP